MAEIESKIEKADHIIKKYILGALAAGLVPVPFLDMAVLSGIQLKMLHRLSNVYDVEFSEHLGKSITASLLGGGIPFSLSFNFGSLAKTVPVYGLITGMMSMALFGGASTYAMGKVFVQHFESGGTLLSFDPQKMRDYYTQELKQGEEEVRKNYAGLKP